MHLEMMMNNHDNFHHATDLSNKAHEFLAQREIPPTPINFSTMYAYFSTDNASLNMAIDELLLTDQDIDSVVLESLFSEHISNTTVLESNLISPLEETLKSTLASIDTQVLNEREAMVNLEKADKALAKLKQHTSLHQVINFVVKSINHSQEQRQTLTEKLNSTSDEVNNLRIQLEESRNEANIDSLTGLLNRRGCDRKLQEVSLDLGHSSLAIDIDHFKKVNDNFGHFIGDKVIQQVAKVIKKTVDSEDIAVRFGGEEFLVVLTNKSIEQAYTIAEKIRHSVESMKLVQRQTKTQLPPISVSIGLAEVEHDNSWNALFKRADQALYQAKNSGRNRCIVSESALA